MPNPAKREQAGNEESRNVNAPSVTPDPILVLTTFRLWLDKTFQQEQSETMANETTIWTSLIPVAVGGGIGIVGSLISPLFLEIHRHKKERLNITAAIISEISAITEVTDRRRYIEMLRNEINHLKTIDNPNYVGWFHFSVRRNPFQVYDANLERIGIISAPLSRDIVRFYSQAASILEDIADMRELKEKSSPNRAVSLQRLEQLLLLFEDTQALGKKIVAEIN